MRDPEEGIDHITPPEVAEVHPSGWCELVPGIEVTKLRLVDPRYRLESGEPLFARLTYAGALAAAERLGASLPSRQDVYATRDHGKVFEPVTLPISSSLARSRQHDVEFWRRLRSSGWGGGNVVVNCGKQWVSGAPKGRAYLAGWWTAHLEQFSKTRRGAGWIQEGALDGPGPHLDGHHDYATTTMLVRPTGGRKTLEGLWDELVATATSAALSLVDSVAAAAESAPERHLARALAEVGVHETPGPASTARIDEYLATAIRGDVPLKLRGDSEFSWCAAFASWCGLPDGMTPRASVAELIADARALGLWRSGDMWHDPKPGDLACYARAGGDPRRGGLGHVNRCIEQVGGGKFRAVGGNETHPSGGAVNVSVRPLTEPIGWIVYSR